MILDCRVESGVTYLQTYNRENRISSITRLANGTCITHTLADYATKWDFAYDGDGTRTTTFTTPYINGVPQAMTATHYYFGGAVETTTAGEVTKYYSFGGQMVAMKEGGTFKYFLSDHLGSTSVVLNASGGILEQQRYLPFGAPRTNPSFNNITSTDLTYTGQRKLDSGMGGIMDYKARFYSPYINRFLQPVFEIARVWSGN